MLYLYLKLGETVVKLIAMDTNEEILNSKMRQYAKEEKLELDDFCITNFIIELD